MKYLKCVSCGRDIARKKTKRRLCIVCLEKRERTRISKLKLNRLSRKLNLI